MQNLAILLGTMATSAELWLKHDWTDVSFITLVTVFGNRNVVNSKSGIRMERQSQFQSGINTITVRKLESFTLELHVHG